MTVPAGPPEPTNLELGNQRIRDAAKWLLASSAAIGAALIAGSQLSTIGRLKVGPPTSVEGARLWVALAGAAISLTAVVYTMFIAVRILLPQSVQAAELAKAWAATDAGKRHPLAPVAAFFRENPKYIQGFETPAALIAHRERVVRQHSTAGTEAEAARLEQEIRDADARIQAVEDMAAHEALKEQFRVSLRRLLPAAAVTAFGIVAFAWAANPPAAPAPSARLRDAQLVDAQLRDADLRGADLRGADLTRADLTGADLTDAMISGVTWSRTICPDGARSDDVGETCAGHLRPR